MTEVQFDGLVGPTHNYAGLSPGNLASAANADQASSPRRAALQGLAKMRAVCALGVVQGFLPPPPRPSTRVLRAVGYGGGDDEILVRVSEEDPDLFRAALSASSMWTANAATVIPASDTADGRTHLVCANLASMLHRAAEAEDTFETLRRVFPDPDRFAVHPPLRLGRHFGDEGAANHMRLCAPDQARGAHVFVHGAPRPGRHPERQARRASAAAARLAGLEDPIFALQAKPAVEAGAFHNDVVAVSSGRLLFAHAEAFDAPDALADALGRRVPGLNLVWATGLDLAAAVRSYLFNSQIVTRPDGRMTLIAPEDVRQDPAAEAALGRLIDAAPELDAVVFADLRESMRNGGGPACLRLRVELDAADLARVDPRFLLDGERISRLERVVERWWPERLAPADLADPALWAQARAAHAALEAEIRAFRT